MWKRQAENSQSSVVPCPAARIPLFEACWMPSKRGPTAINSWFFDCALNALEPRKNRLRFLPEGEGESSWQVSAELRRSGRLFSGRTLFTELDIKSRSGRFSVPSACVFFMVHYWQSYFSPCIWRGSALCVDFWQLRQTCSLSVSTIPVTVKSYCPKMPLFWVVKRLARGKRRTRI